jgi:hypothetical protein
MDSQILSLCNVSREERAKHLKALEEIGEGETFVGEVSVITILAKRQEQRFALF